MTSNDKSGESLSNLELVTRCIMEANLFAFGHMAAGVKLAEIAINRGLLKKVYTKPIMTIVGVSTFNLGFMNYILTNRCQNMVLTYSDDERMRERARLLDIFKRIKET